MIGYRDRVHPPLKSAVYHFVRRDYRVHRRHIRVKVKLHTLQFRFIFPLHELHRGYCVIVKVHILLGPALIRIMLHISVDGDHRPDRSRSGKLGCFLRIKP